MRSLFLGIACISVVIVPAWSHGSLLIAACSDELDLAVAAYNNGDGAAADLFEQLEQNCAELPQVHHNLGVLAANQQRWETAIEHFRRAIANDSRTNMTLEQLQAIHHYQAAKAYQNALGNSSQALNSPQFSLQDSSNTNQTYSVPPKTTLHSVPTVEYELYSWWSAAAQNSAASWLEHYSPGYPPAENLDAKKISWSDVARDISFTAQDAVVVLNYRVEKVEKRTLLLLRLQNNRWKIYRETVL